MIGEGYQIMTISSSLASLYFLSSMIISLVPLNIALRTTWLLSCSLDKVSDVGTLLETSILCPSTDTSIRDFLCLCHDLISLSYHFPLFYISISSFQPFSQLCSCSYSVVGTVSQAIFVLLLFHSPFGQYLMGTFLKY